MALRKPLLALLLLMLATVGHAPGIAGAAAPPPCTIDGSASGTVITGTPGNDVICGNGGNDVIYGNGGRDVLRGGTGNDVLYGQGDDDTLYGEAGDDRMLGGPGKDFMEGGTETDTVDYSPQSRAIKVTIGAGGANDGLDGGAEGDTVRATVEAVRGGAGADDITGDASAERFDGGKGDDTLRGLGGGDRFVGGLGADTFIGGLGTADAVDYSSATGPVTATIGEGGANDGAYSEDDEVGGDIETLIGSKYGDDLSGGAGANVLYGGEGDDDLHGAGGNDQMLGGLGADEFDGGPDTDLVTYADLVSGAVTVSGVDVSVGDAADGDGRSGEGDDVEATVERVIGTRFGDRLRGTTTGVRLDGLDGPDTLLGSSGADVLNGGAGGDEVLSRDGVADQVDCGDDVDTYDADALEASLVDCETEADEPPAFTSSATPSVAENTTSVGTVDADDPEGGTVTYSVTGGADQALFAIDTATGALSFNAAPDFEAPADAGANNVYDVEVTASDGAKTAAQSVAATVTDVDEAPGGLALDDSTVDENHPAGTPVGKMAATDPEGGAVTFSLVSGAGDADNAKFRFSDAAGDDPDDLAAAVANLDHENPTDADGDGNYQVRIQARDGAGNTDVLQATITVNDLAEPPVLATMESAALAYTENDAAKDISETLTVSDPEGDAIATATIMFVANYASGQDVLSFTDTPAIEKVPGGFDPATGELRLRSVGGGTRSLATWQAALRDVAYANPSEDPSTATRTLGVTVDTGAESANESNRITRDVAVTAVNDAPSATGDSFTDAKRAVGNTALVLDGPDAGAAPDPNGPQKTVTGNLLSNDSDVDSPAAGFVLTAVADGTSSDGGRYTIEPDGDFTFVPTCKDAQDQFSYEISDGHPTDPKTSTANITVAVADCVWYVDSTAEATGANGSSRNPFTTLAGVNGVGDPDTTGDRLFVYGGTYGGGLTLEASQRLLSKRHGLALDNGDGDGDLTDLTLETPGGGNPSLAGGVVLATDNTVQGIDFGGAVGPALSGTSFGTATVNTATSGVVNNPSGQAVDLSGGTLDMAFSQVSSSNSAADGIRLHNTTGGFSASGGTIANATGQDVDITGDDSGDDVNFTYAGAISDDVGQLVNVSDQTGGLKHFTGAITDGNDGDGSGIRHASNSSSTETRFSGQVVLSTGANAALTIEGPGDVPLTNASGAIATTSGTGVDITAGESGQIAVNVPITTQTGSPVSIAGRTGGNIQFPRSIQDATSAGIILSGNAGTAIGFSGTVEIDTNGTPAVAATGNPGSVSFTGGGLDLHNANGRTLRATGGGTIEVGGAGNVLDSDAGGGALEVSGGTTIADGSGAAGDTGLRFQRIDSAGGTNGIKLDATGTTGSLTVQGAGTAGSGGTISGASGAGVLLDATRAADLNRVLVQNNTGDGIDAVSVPNGITLADSTVSGNGNANVGGDRTFEDRGLDFQNVSGAISLLRSTIATSTDTNAHIHNTTAAAATLTVTGTTITGAGNAGLRLIGENASNVTANVTQSTFALNEDPSFSMQTNQGAGAKQTLVFDDNDVSGGNSAGIPGRPQIAISTDGGGSQAAKVHSDVDVRISNNDIRPGLGAEIILNTLANASSSATLDAVVTGNVISDDDAPGVADPGVDSGSAIWGWAHGDGKMRVAITNNVIQNWGGRALELSHNDGNGSADYTVTHNTINTPDQTNNVFEGIYAIAGTDNQDTETSDVCIDLRENDMDGIGRQDVGDLSYDRYGPNAKLRFAGVETTTDAALQNHLRIVNPASPTFTTMAFGNQFSPANATACSAPQNTP